MRASRIALRTYDDLLQSAPASNRRDLGREDYARARPRPKSSRESSTNLYRAYREIFGGGGVRSLSLSLFLGPRENSAAAGAAVELRSWPEFRGISRVNGRISVTFRGAIGHVRTRRSIFWTVTRGHRHRRRCRCRHFLGKNALSSRFMIFYPAT